MEYGWIKWPAIVKHSGDAELRYVADQAEWDSNVELQVCDYHAADCLIDSSGAVFSLTQRQGHRVTAVATGEFKTLQDVLGLVKAHAAQAGSCCVAKLYAPSIRDAFAIVKTVSDDDP
jgi:hypothetical protein